MDLSDYFRYISLTERDAGYLKDYIESPKDDKSFARRNNELFKNISKNLGGDDRFIKLGFHVCCPYINYWLNFIIEDKYKNLVGNNFENFKNFADYYAERKHGESFNKNTCKSYLKPLLNEQKYVIMKRLYDMYNFFDLVIRYIGTNNKEGICHYYALVNFYYKDLHEISKTNTDLSKILNYFLRVIKNSKHPYDQLCGKNFLSLMLQPTVSTSSQETPGISGQSLSAGVASDSQNPEVTEANLEGAGSTNEGAFLEKSKVSKSPIEEPPNTVLPVVKVPSEEQRTELEEAKFATGSLPGLKEKLYRGDHTFGRSKVRPEVERMTSEYGVIDTDGDLTPIQGELPQGVSEPKGILTNVQDTFFSIVKDVDPAPVLGVSGGMGVLFILFKVFKDLKL
ncbi:hypothetical protein PVNG_05784 [Plasmodium vivax North Korean]|uniref:VIR protein n=1 Tax=Plasmodium vivax North Korean TaxID=1035514 RepID=A0A0J9WF16_PLAVI|nr:hypothetical protein PVNG_05784 [Plasmodium vivax North Korean]